MISPSVLRECGLPRSDLGVEITEIVLNLVQTHKQIQVWHRNTEDLASYDDLRCMVDQTLDRKPQLPDRKIRHVRGIDCPVSPLYLEFVRDSSSRYGELIMYHASHWQPQ